MVSGGDLAEGGGVDSTNRIVEKQVWLLPLLGYGVYGYDPKFWHRGDVTE